MGVRRSTYTRPPLQRPTSLQTCQTPRTRTGQRHVGSPEAPPVLHPPWPNMLQKIPDGGAAACRAPSVVRGAACSLWDVRRCRSLGLHRTVRVRCAGMRMGGGQHRLEDLPLMGPALCADEQLRLHFVDLILRLRFGAALGSPWENPRISGVGCRWRHRHDTGPQGGHLLRTAGMGLPLAAAHQTEGCRTAGHCARLGNKRHAGRGGCCKRRTCSARMIRSAGVGCHADASSEAVP